MTRVITKQSTDEMQQYRQDDLSYSCPELKREDFADDNAYREALVAQYQELRRQEFQYVVYNEAMKAYNVSSEANANKSRRVENTTGGAWGGYGHATGAQDSSFVYVPDMVKVGDTPNQGESCAISANALVMKISDEMGYTGKDNLIVPKSRLVTNKKGKAIGVSSKNNLSVAAYIHLQESIPQEYRVSYTDKKNKPSLNDAIKQGIVGAGDEISLVTGKATSTTSGCHAMVIVDVQKDENGEVKGYTLQGNNPPCLINVDANNPDYYGKRPLNSAVRVSKWIDDKISAEIPADMSSEELSNKVKDTQTRVSTVVDNLHDTEVRYVEKKHYNDVKPVGRSEGFGEHYNKTLDEARQAAQDRADAAQRENDVAQSTEDKEENSAGSSTRDEMKNSQGELAENENGKTGAKVAIKGGRVEGAVDYNDAKKDLDKKDERSAQEALRDGRGNATSQSRDVNKSSTNEKADETTGPASQTPDIRNEKKSMTVQEAHAYLLRRHHR